MLQMQGAVGKVDNIRDLTRRDGERLEGVALRKGEEGPGDVHAGHLRPGLRSTTQPGPLQPWGVFPLKSWGLSQDQPGRAGARGPFRHRCVCVSIVSTWGGAVPRGPCVCVCVSVLSAPGGEPSPEAPGSQLPRLLCPQKAGRLVGPGEAAWGTPLGRSVPRNSVDIRAEAGRTFLTIFSQITEGLG